MSQGEKVRRDLPNLILSSNVREKWNAIKDEEYRKLIEMEDRKDRNWLIGMACCAVSPFVIVGIVIAIKEIWG